LKGSQRMAAPDWPMKLKDCVKAQLIRKE